MKECDSVGVDYRSVTRYLFQLLQGDRLLDFRSEPNRARVREAVQGLGGGP